MMNIFRILLILCVLKPSIHSFSDNDNPSPASSLSNPNVSSSSFSRKSAYTPSDSDDSRRSRSKSMSGATKSVSPTDLSATESESSSGRTIAPGNGAYHEKMHPYYDRKSEFHQKTHDFYKADNKERYFANSHKDEATSSYKKARKHETWERRVKSGEMQPGRKTAKDVPSDGCPSPPCCNGQTHCLRKNRNYDWPHRKGARRLLPVKVSKKRSKRIYESSPSQALSDIGSDSSSGAPSSPGPSKRKKDK